MVADAINSDFVHALEEFINEGGYQEGYSNKRKTAYRFEKPLEPNEFPRIIEFFIEEDKFPQSNDNRFAKLDIVVNEEKISAMVLDKEVFNFANSNTKEFDSIRFSSPSSLIALKTHAYFENLKLYKDGHKVKSDDYKKHRGDIVSLLVGLNEEEFSHIKVPNVIFEQMSEFENLFMTDSNLIKSIKSKHVDPATLIATYHRIYK